MPPSGTKMRPNENVKATTLRIVEQILEKSKVSFKYADREVLEEKEESPSYPGVVTVYRKHIVEGNVLSLALKPNQVEVEVHWSAGGHDSSIVGTEKLFVSRF